MAAGPAFEKQNPFREKRLDFLSGRARDQNRGAPGKFYFDVASRSMNTGITLAAPWVTVPWSRSLSS